MKPVRRLLHWLDARREDADLRAELEFHRTEVQRHLEARGVDPSQARLQSQRVMGNLTLAPPRSHFRRDRHSDAGHRRGGHDDGIQRR
jgi:hypothetical protein